MSAVLGTYLRRRVAGQMLAMLAVLTGIMQVLELLDVTTDVLDRELGLAGIARYALLRMPSELLVALPLAVLLGAMSALYSMARNREITALRASGVSIGRILRALLPLPFLFAVAQVALSQSIVPWAESTLKVWWDETAPLEERSPERWVHTSTGPVSFERNSADGRRLQRIRIYQRDDQGLLTLRTFAREATWTGDGWQLEGVQVLSIGKDRSTRDGETERRWQSNLRPEDIVSLNVAQPHLSSIMLTDVIAGERVGAQPLTYYQTVLLRSYSAPLGLFIMLLLGVSPAMTMERGAGGGRLLAALGLGLGFLLCDGIASALGTSGQVPALAAALTAPAAFTVIGLVQLLTCDRV